MNAEAQKLIAALQLAPLPREGGWFRPTWRSAAGSAIYFLMTPEDFSALHRMRTDEVWHFYGGDAVEHIALDPRDGAIGVTRLGPDVLGGDTSQLVARGGSWQGARVATGGSGGWALLGCTMAPAWDEREFELGERAALLREFPAAADLIHALTR